MGDTTRVNFFVLGLGVNVHTIEGTEGVLIIREKHSYVMFLPPDMLAVKRFRNELENSLLEHGFPIDDIQQIELACDEALTNSITANIKYASRETIICRWKVENLKFILTIMDYGRGVPREKILSTEKPTSLGEILEKFQKREMEPVNILPFSGVCRKHKNMGQGLNIIQKIMDRVNIFYHKNDQLYDTLIDSVEGSILEMEFSCKKS